MKKLFLVGIILGSFLTSCELESDYTCNCTYTLGVTQGSETYSIVDASESDAQLECDNYESELGGNTKCELE